MPKDFGGYAVLIYDGGGKQVANTKVLAYSEYENSIEIDDLPALTAGELCEVMILAVPKPYASKGRIHKRGSRKLITLFKGSEKEDRRETRHRIDMTAVVEGLVCDGKVHPLLCPVEIRLFNISRDGMRIRTTFQALTKGNRVKVRLKIGEEDKLLTVDAVYQEDHDREYSEYGCRLIGENDG